MLSGCDGCKERKPHQKKQAPPRVECSSALDCGEPNACLGFECVDGACQRLTSAEGTSCDNDDVCDGVARCDGKGSCIPGSAPKLDDGNACTTDTCDPKTGPSHVPVAVDDSDVCTTDTCDPTTGEVTHTAVDTDDGDDCTFDSCDPTSGISHKRIEARYTCDASCGSGFHVAARSQNVRCGSREAVETFCVPDCGDSFYSCEASCPERYEKKAETANPRCGPAPSRQIFCMKKP